MCSECSSSKGSRRLSAEGRVGGRPNSMGGWSPPSEEHNAFAPTPLGGESPYLHSSKFKTLLQTYIACVFFLISSRYTTCHTLVFLLFIILRLFVIQEMPLIRCQIQNISLVNRARSEEKGYIEGRKIKDRSAKGDRCDR